MAFPVYRTARIPWCLIMLSLCLMLSSCQTYAEAEHLEHVTPEHKPASYTDAIIQIRQRFREVLDGKLEGSLRSQRLSELGDILRWLPEIAAESDLKKSQWEQVEQISRRLTALQSSLSSTAKLSAEQLGEIEEQLQTLDSLNAFSDRLQPHSLQNK